MNRQKSILFCAALFLIGGTTLAVSHLKSHQKLGEPGIKTMPLAGDIRRQLYLPPKAGGYECAKMGADKDLSSGLPPDTSINQAFYWQAGVNPESHPLDFVEVNLVMMGTDRTSIHKPEFCLTSQGWNIDSAQTGLDTIRIPRPHPYDLQVFKTTTSHQATIQGHSVNLRGIYVYWFIADNDLTAEHTERMWRSAVHLVKTGELERWAYVGVFAVCLPGDEEKTYEKLKDFIISATPEFQTATNPEVK